VGVGYHQRTIAGRLPEPRAAARPAPRQGFPLARSAANPAPFAVVFASIACTDFLSGLQLPRDEGVGGFAGSS
jgi:hypothetical protein